MKRAVLVWACIAATTWGLRAQGPADASPSPRAQAPRDISGYWVSIVTEDWHWRMVTPRKGDFASLPLNDEGRRVANAWDAAKDAKSGAACKAYGAAAIMRVPGRLRVSWENETTLSIQTDAGTQTRRLYFGKDVARSWSVNARGEIEWRETGRAAPRPAGAGGLQGYSVARWELAPDPEAVRAVAFFAGGLGTGPDGAGVTAKGRFGSLHVVTSDLSPGYLRRNGVPYSAGAKVTEDFDFRTEDDGTEWFTVTTVVDDPLYLSAPFVTSTDFRKEADGSKWRPTPCSAD